MTRVRTLVYFGVTVYAVTVLVTLIYLWYPSEKIPESQLDNLSKEKLLEEWYSMMKTIIHQDPRKIMNSDADPNSLLKHLEINARNMTYSPFNFTLPFFASEDDKKLFLMNADNKKTVKFYNESELLKGRIGILQNAKAHHDSDCGFRTKDSYFYKEDVATSLKKNIIAVPLLVPDSWAWQHFIDGVLPKIIQALDVLLLTDAKIVIYKPRDPVIYEILNELQITSDKIVIYTKMPMFFKKVVNACVVPPLHPVLWNTARKVLRVPDTLPPLNDTFVVLLTRAGSHNGQRNIVNFNEVKKMLSLRYGHRFVVFKSGLNLKQAKFLYGRSAIIIGVHGGAMYNLLFAPQNTHIVEIMPFTKKGNPLPGTAHKIFWVQAQLVGQPYWRMHVPPVHGNVDVPLAQLADLLDKVDIALNS